MQSNHLQKTVMAALLCAVVFVFTFLSIPMGIGNVNLGDGALLLTVWTLGGPWAAVSAALGSALADLASGYALYAPATFVIKGAMVAVALLVLHLLSHTKLSARIRRLLSAVAAELLMVLGYLVYEAALLGYGAGALVSVPFNAVQGLVAIVVSGVLYEALSRVGILSKDQRFGPKK